MRNLPGFSLSRSREPNWYRWHPALAWRVPSAVRGWLADPGSLTSRVMACCAGRFRVLVVDQGWALPMHSEARLLGSTRIALSREVLLLCDGRPWVFARTLIPADSLRGGAGRLRLLGDRPLGAVLFADPSTRRERMEVARLSAGDVLYRRAISASGDAERYLWGRRTLFRYAGKPLLVNEIFLPGLDSR